MASPQKPRTSKFPLDSPAEWIADGHVTCNIQCSGGKCHQRMVNVRLDTLPQNLPWSQIGRRQSCGCNRKARGRFSWEMSDWVQIGSAFVLRSRGGYAKRLNLLDWKGGRVV
jgi:hypothetical protein